MQTSVNTDRAMHLAATILASGKDLFQGFGGRSDIFAVP